MSRETDLLYAVLALQTNLITKDQLLECLALQASDRRQRLPSVLDAKGYVKPSEQTALKAMVKAHLKRHGDAGKSMASLNMDEDVRRTVDELVPLAEDSGTLLRWKGGGSMQSGDRDAEPNAAPVSGEKTIEGLPATPQADGFHKKAGLRTTEGEKYEFRSELGRGGLGRVVEAIDNDIGRAVAVKMMHSGPMNRPAVERFLFEGRVAGRLTHPNIVSVHEIGLLKREEGEAPYFTMEKIAGCDLGKVLKDLKHGDESVRKRFNRHRLLRIFQDVCNAISYAHDHGVIHRDLKPANIMVGEYGEVYVVDWGLAKMVGQRDEPSSTLVVPGKPLEPDASDFDADLHDSKQRKLLCKPSPQEPDHDNQQTDHVNQARENQPVLTLEGTVMGTPAYMPPEQADGRISEIDERSDIYSLGAILYEILTLRPPFEGNSACEVIAKVLDGRITLPSVILQRSQCRESFPEAVPPELDEIVIKAMTMEKGARHASARDLHDEVQLFLEGEKERERNRERAMAKVEAGRVLVKQMGKLRENLEAARREAAAKGRAVKPHWPVEKKAESWAAQNRVKTLSRQVVEKFTEAGNTLQEALTFERNNHEARAALADLYWNQYAREEEAGNEAEMIHYEALVRQYNDGQYDAKLRGDGTLAITTRHFPCRCLTEGRWVDPEELVGERVEGLGSRVELADNNYEEVYQKLQGSERLAERDGLGRQDVRGDGKHACEGDVRADVADEKSSGVGAEQHPELNPRPSPLDPYLRGIMGYHPMSGRALDGHKGAEGLPDLEPKEPIFLKVHGACCRTEPLDGADAWLFRFEERDRIMVPVLPQDVRVEGRGYRVESDGTATAPFHPSTLPPSVLDRLYDPDSPFRPKEGLYLGKTPIAPFRLPMGSYLLIIAYRKKGSVEGRGSRVEKGERVKGEAWKGESKIPEESAGSSLYPLPSTLHPDKENEFAPVRVPVFIGRCADEAVDVTLYHESGIPPGFIQIPAGKFIYQGDRENQYSTPRQVIEIVDCFIAKFPVTCGEYLEFINDAVSEFPEESARRVPRKAPTAGFYWPAGDGGSYCIPTEKWVSGAPEAHRKQAFKLEMSPVWWEEEWPVFGVSWEDMVAFAAWRTRREARLFTLPHDMAWEKSARGADGRFHPWGKEFDAAFCCANQSVEDTMRPARVDSFPADESPYGVRGLGGNCRDKCLNDPGGANAGWRTCRGGHWATTGFYFRASLRSGLSASDVLYGDGGRLSWLPCSRTPMGK